MLTVPTYRENITNKQQSDIEEAQVNGGIPEFVRQETLVIANGPQSGAGYDLTTTEQGQVISYGDKYQKFQGDTIGRKV